MTTLPRLRAAGFTLIELIIVITIIVMLAGLIVGAFGFVRDKQARDQAQLQIALLSRAIQEYELDMGAMPGQAVNTNDGFTDIYGGIEATGSEGDYSEVLYTALFYEGYEFSTNPDRLDNRNIKATTIYLSELDPNNNRQGWLNPTTGEDPPEELKILDPWGNNYLYRVGRLANGDLNSDAMNPDFDLWSSGKDGRTQTPPPYDPDEDGNRDDIRNF